MTIIPASSMDASQEVGPEKPGQPAASTIAGRASFTRDRESWSVSRYTGGSHAFGVTPSFRLGVEEEHLLVSPDGAALANGVETLIAEAKDVDGTIDGDTFAACIELATPVTATAEEAYAKLSDLRRAAGACDESSRLMAAAVHPSAPWGGLVHIDRPRYRRLASELGVLLDRTPTCALHVHVGVPDPDAAITVCNRMRKHLAVLAALAANSPFCKAKDTGFASSRWTVWRAYPRTGVPPTFVDYEDYLRHVRDICDAGGLEDFSFIWWDIRPNPRVGTIEVRIMDTQSSLPLAAAMAGLVHALVVLEAHAPQRSRAEPIAGATDESCFRAARDGMCSELWTGGSYRPAREVARDTIAQAAPVARDLGFERALEPLQELVFRSRPTHPLHDSFSTGGLSAVIDRLLEQTMTLAAPSGAQHGPDASHGRRIREPPPKTVL